MKVCFTVDALHIIEEIHAETDVPDIALGLALMHSILQKVAKRAIELKDKKMLDLMLKLHLVEKTGGDK